VSQGGKWVINMSIGGPKNSSTNTAVRNARKAGIIVAVAAGNNGKTSSPFACNYSPSSAAEALTVGATTSSDQRSSFSNYGSCVDLFAPGSSVVSLGTTSNSNSPNAKSLSGTSMASPHVAGAAAIFYQLYDTADEAESALMAATASGKISDTKSGTPNLLLQVPSTLNSVPLPACNQGEVNFEFSLQTDDYSYADNGYKLVKQGVGQPLFVQPIGFQTTSARNAIYVETKCLTPGSYTLTVEDAYGDGLCCRYGLGYYQVKFNGAKQNSYSSRVGTVSTQQLGWGKTATHAITIP
jgi:subtilisin family serine protease